MKRVLLLLVLLFIGVNVSNAQTYKANVSNSKLSVTGTSTLHDWECVVKDFTGTVNATVENGTLTGISYFDFSFKVKSLDSGKSAMDKKVYEALKEKKNSTISYKGTKVVLKDGKATFYGKMSIAGTTKDFETPVAITYTNGKLTLKGEQGFKLPEFNVEPPTAMFGTITTGEAVAIHYNIELTSN